jgi:hypothetical protein
MLKIEDLNLHELSYNRFGEFEELNFENEFHFIDFLNEDELSDLQYNILSSFSFNTVVTRNYHHHYFNKMYIEINQLNYGRKRYDIFNDERLTDELETCIEIGRLDKETKYEILYLFREAIDNFVQQVYELERSLKD